MNSTSQSVILRQPVRFEGYSLPAARTVLRWLLLLPLFIVSPSLAIAQLLKSNDADVQPPESGPVENAVQAADSQQTGTLTSSRGLLSNQVLRLASLVRVDFLYYLDQTPSIRDHSPDESPPPAVNEIRNQQDRYARSPHAKRNRPACRPTKIHVYGQPIWPYNASTTERRLSKAVSSSLLPATGIPSRYADMPRVGQIPRPGQYPDD
jgi:hypothetical protein